MSTTFPKTAVPGDEVQIRKLIQSVELAYGEKQSLSHHLLPPAKLHWESLSVTVDGDKACCTGYLRVTRDITGKSTETSPAVSRWRCATIRLRRIRGAWRILRARFRAASDPAELATALPGASRASDLPLTAPLPAPCLAPCAPAFDLRP
jgi:ketosteroid isomerase-like protein